MHCSFLFGHRYGIFHMSHKLRGVVKDKRQWLVPCPASRSVAPRIISPTLQFRGHCMHNSRHLPFAHVNSDLSTAAFPRSLFLELGPHGPIVHPNSSQAARVGENVFGKMKHGPKVCRPRAEYQFQYLTSLQGVPIKSVCNDFVYSHSVASSSWWDRATDPDVYSSASNWFHRHQWRNPFSNTFYLNDARVQKTFIAGWSSRDVSGNHKWSGRTQMVSYCLSSQSSK